MTWFRLDDNFYFHPKVRAAGNAAVGLWVRCCTYSAAHKEDGRIDSDAAHHFGTRKEIARLVDVGLWLPNGHGFIVPDFLVYNPSKAEIEAREAETSAIKRAGGQARARTAQRDNAGHFLPDS